MTDPYLYKDTPVLKNLFNIQDKKELDLLEAELSSANMMLLYEAGFSDFSATGTMKIHHFLFGEVYPWAGTFRVINVKKSEQLLAGISVWYSDVDTIETNLDKAWKALHKVNWNSLSKQEFCRQIALHFSEIWKIHPFREGNTRTVVMLMTFFIESHGYYFDKELLAASAGYVRNSFVLASLNEYSEYQHLEKILNDAIKTQPDNFNDLDLTEISDSKKSEYAIDEYVPREHEVRGDDELPSNYKELK